MIIKRTLSLLHRIPEANLHLVLNRLVKENPSPESRYDHGAYLDWQTEISDKLFAYFV